MDRLADIRKMKRNVSGETQGLCEVFPPLRSPRNGATSLRRPAPPAEALGVGDWALDPSNPLRAWLYQACTEFGYYEVRPLSPAVILEKKQNTICRPYSS